MNTMNAMNSFNLHKVNYCDDEHECKPSGTSNGYRFLGRSSPNQVDCDFTLNAHATKFSTESVACLKAWLTDHLHRPYPDRDELESLAAMSGLSREQVNNWFTNIRKRKLKLMRETPSVPKVQDHDNIDASARSERMRMTQYTFAPYAPQTITPNGFDRSVSLVTPNQIVVDGIDDEVEVYKVIAPFTPFRFNADETIDSEVTDAEIKSLMEDSDELWSMRMVILLAREERLIELRALPSESKVAFANKNYSHFGNTPIPMTNFYQPLRKENFSPEKALLLTSPESKHANFDSSIDFDCFSLDLGIMDHEEGFVDAFGIMAEFHSQNM
jgi:Homeobox KN domain